MNRLTTFKRKPVARVVVGKRTSRGFSVVEEIWKGKWDEAKFDAAWEKAAARREELGEDSDEFYYLRTFIGGKQYYRAWECPGCGAVCVGHGAQYCTRECQKKHNSRQQAEDRKLSRQALLMPRPCEHCGEKFEPKRKDARFCSAKCRVYHARGK